MQRRKTESLAREGIRNSDASCSPPAASPALHNEFSDCVPAPFFCLFVPLKVLLFDIFIGLCTSVWCLGDRAYFRSTTAGSACLQSPGPLNCHDIVFSGVFV